MIITANNNPAVQTTLSVKPLTVLPTHLSAEQKLLPTNKDTFFLSETSKLHFNFENWLKEPTQLEYSAEKKAQIASLYSKVSDEQFITLVARGMTDDDNFLSITSKSTDEEVVQLVDIVDKLSAPANTLFSHINEYYKHGTRSGKEKLTQFINVLAQSKPQLQKELISQAHQHSEKITLDKNPSKDTYINQKKDYFNPKSNANDLQNFVSTVIDSESPRMLVEKLSQYTPEQQSNLLNVLGFDQHEGERLLDGLLDKSDEAKDSILSFLGDLTLKTNPFIEIKTFTTSKHSMLKGSDNLFDTVHSMVNNAVSLLDNYNFSDEQLTNLGDDLSKLNRKDQIAYLEVAKIGLDNLLGGKKDEDAKRINMAEHPEAMNTLQSILHNKDALNNVYKTRGDYDKESRYPMAKSLSQYKKDVTEIVSLYIPSIKKAKEV